MLEAALWCALGCAAVSALAGCRAAWALVPSVALCLYADGRVEFHPDVWRTIDCAAAALILGLTRPMKLPDWLIVALIPVAWAAYTAPDPARYVLSAWITIAQLLLTIRRDRMVRLYGHWKATWAHHHDWTRFDLRKAHLC